MGLRSGARDPRAQEGQDLEFGTRGPEAWSKAETGPGAQVQREHLGPREAQQPKRGHRQSPWKAKQKVGNPEAQFNQWTTVKELGESKEGEC